MSYFYQDKKLEARSSKLEARSSKLEARSSKLFSSLNGRLLNLLLSLSFVVFIQFVATAQAPQSMEVLPVQKYGCEDAAGAEALAYALAEQQAAERGWALREVSSVDRMPESCGMRSAEWQFSYVDEKSGEEHLLLQRLEFTDATPLYVRFPRDCFCTQPIASWDELAPALLSLRYGVQRARPITEGGNCERPALEYEDELLQWNEQTGYFVLLRHWEVHQPCPNGEVYRDDQYVRGILKSAEPLASGTVPPVESPSVISAHVPKVKSFLHLHPNPAGRDLYVNFSVSGQIGAEVRIELLDVMGIVRQSVVVQNTIGEVRFFMEELPAGVYWVRLRTAGEQMIRAVVKQGTFRGY